MTDRASLKRKLDHIDQERRTTGEALRVLESRLDRYREREIQIFIQKHCTHVTKFSKNEPRRFRFDNGMVGFIWYDDLTSIEVVEGRSDIGSFSVHYGPQLSPSVFSEWDSGAQRMRRVVEFLPVIEQLVRNVLPAWIEVSKDLDVETLMTARTLRWIAQHLPGNTQWPDIITGNFPL